MCCRGHVKKDVGQEGGKNERRAVGIDIDDAPDAMGEELHDPGGGLVVWGITFMKS